MRILLVIIAGLMVTACETSSIKSGSDANPAVNIAGYRTFSWVADNPLVAVGGDTTRVNPLLQQRIQNAILADLAGKGYRYVDDRAGADFVVGFTIGARDKIDVRSYPTAGPTYGYYGRYRYGGWGGTYWGTEVRTDSYTEGVLAIDVFDVRSQQPAWHAWSTKKIRDKDRQNPGPVVIEVVTSTLADFPARSS